MKILGQKDPSVEIALEKIEMDCATMNVNLAMFCRNEDVGLDICWPTIIPSSELF